MDQEGQQLGVEASDGGSGRSPVCAGRPSRMERCCQGYRMPITYTAVYVTNILFNEGIPNIVFESCVKKVIVVIFDHYEKFNDNHDLFLPLSTILTKLQIVMSYTSYYVLLHILKSCF